MGPCTLHNPSYDFNDDLIPVGGSMWVKFVGEAWFARKSDQKPDQERLGRKLDGKPKRARKTSAGASRRICRINPRHWDNIVIGAGSAGCAVAARLSEGGRSRTLLLEAGPPNRSMLFKAPAGVGLFKISRYDWGYHSTADPTRNDRTEYWPRGRVMGGSSSINGMNYVRGSAGDFDRWADAGLTGWDANNIARLYKDLERCDPHSIPANACPRLLSPLHVRMVKDSSSCHSKPSSQPLSLPAIPLIQITTVASNTGSATNS